MNFFRSNRKGLVRVWIACLALSLLDGPTAQAGEPVTPEDIHEDLVVTAQIRPEHLDDSVYWVKVFDQARIRSQNALELGQLLKFEPGIDLSQHSVFGTSAAIQGVSGENVKILIDGVPIVGRLNGIIDLAQLALSEVSRVEMIRGSTSVFYGTDALAGVINIINHEPSGPNLAAETSYQSVGERSLSARAGIGKDRHALNAQMAMRTFDGYSSESSSRKQDWNGRDQVSGKLTYSLLLGKMKLATNVWLSQEDMRDRGLPKDGIATDTDYHTARGHQTLSLKGFLLAGDYVDFHLSHADYERTLRARQVGLTATGGATTLSIEVPNQTAFDLWLGRGSWTKTIPGADLQLGFDYTLETATGGRIRDDRQSSTEYAFFSALKFQPFAKMTVQPALRMTKNDTYDSPVTPALNLKLDPNPDLSVRGSYARGFRGPSLKEVYLDFTMQAGPSIYHIIGNQDLVPETGDHYGLSIHHRAEIIPASVWNLEASLFHNRIDHLIALSAIQPDDQVPGQLMRQYVNIDHHKSFGGEILISTGAASWSAQFVVARTAYLNDFRGMTGAPDYDYATDIKVQGDFRPADGAMVVSLIYKWNGSRKGFYLGRDANSGQQELREASQNAYQLLDLNFSRPLLDKAFTIQVGAKNLFDVKNLNQIDMISGSTHATNHLDWGRHYFASFRYEWHR